MLATLATKACLKLYYVKKTLQAFFLIACNIFYIFYRRIAINSQKKVLQAFFLIACNTFGKMHKLNNINGCK